MSFNPIRSGSAWKKMPRMPIPRSHRASGAACAYFSSRRQQAARGAKKGGPTQGTRAALVVERPLPPPPTPETVWEIRADVDAAGAKGVLVNRAYTCMFRSDVTV